MKVYFIQAGKGAVKIGKANNVDIRLKELQTGNHEKLHIILVIACDSQMHALELEREFHFKFRKSKIRGEWFRKCVLKKLRENSLDEFMDKELSSRFERSYCKRSADPSITGI